MNRSMIVCLTTVLVITASRGWAQQGEITLASGGKATCQIVVAADASAAETHAAAELAKFLGQVTGATFDVVSPDKAGAGPKIAVGPGAAKAVAPEVELKDMGNDGIVMKSVGANLVLSGQDKALRGTLYAVYTFLEDVVGCRWWTSGVSTIPSRPELKIAPLNVRYVPLLEYREVDYLDAFDGDWSVRNKNNGTMARVDEARGGKVSYAGFVHTFYPLVPPKEHFAAHPEWYSLIKGKRTVEHGQLCLTNSELKAFVILRVKQLLEKNPRAIVSVSQNDWHGNCQCEKCVAVEKEEGSPSGLLLRFVNDVAAAVETQYPHAAIDTLAYQYTRKPPKITKPRPNVIVRLCSIECSFAHPLSHAKNAAFRDDIEGWSKICQRLYVWDYVTDFTDYVQPYPDLRVLDQNVRFFVSHGVKGIFEEGNYGSRGGEMAELRAWVLAKLLWNPQLKGEDLANEFADGYYGPAGGPIRQYIKLVHDRVEKLDYYMTINSPTTAPFLSADVMIAAELLFQQAEKAVADKPELLRCVEVAHLPVRYVLIRRWDELRVAAEKGKLAWPLTMDRVGTVDDFERVCKANNVTQLCEWSGKTLPWLRKMYGTRPATGPASKPARPTN